MHVFAQYQAPLDGVTIDASNYNPMPGQTVDITLESFSFDLNSSSIVWQVAGKVHSKGVGIKTISVKAPSIGSKLNVSAIIKSPDGTETTKVYTIKSGAVDIIWESNGYRPPFYKGKLPYIYQNSIKLVAVPHFSKSGTKEIDPKTLVYTWKLGGKFIDGGQGYGKQSVVITSSIIPKPLEISVDVTNREQTDRASGSIVLNPTEPIVTFYEDDALYGTMYNKSIVNSTSLKNSEMKVVAVPFGFNLRNDKTIFNWSINNIDQPELLKNRSITIRSKGDMDGNSLIGLDVRNEVDILQGAKNNFTVYFKKNTR
jgi:hypothetical protein